MKDDKIMITVEQAISVISTDEMIHTFRSMPGILMGADWSWDKLIESFHQYHDRLEIGGDQCKKMGHALVMWTPEEPLFIEADKEKIEALEKELS